MEAIRFVINGEPRTLTQQGVMQSARKIEAAEIEPIQTWAVEVEGRLFPVKQLFGAATGLDRDSFVSDSARRLLAKLGLRVIKMGTALGARSAPVETNESKTIPEAIGQYSPAQDWFWEGNIQAKLVSFLVTDGWSIQSVADTAAGQRGFDIIAINGSRKLIVEVKGYPSDKYANGGNVGEPKRTNPTVQAPVWFAGALLSAIRGKSSNYSAEFALGFPDVPRYRNLLQETEWALMKLGIGVYLVTEEGKVLQSLLLADEVK